MVESLESCLKISLSAFYLLRDFVERLVAVPASEENVYNLKFQETTWIYPAKN